MNQDSLLERRLGLFPLSTRVTQGEEPARLTIAGCDLASLADKYGTPLYVFDRLTMDQAAADYRQALARFYPGPSGLTYAAKAFLCLAIAQWAYRNDLWLDCTGAGEIATAVAAGVPRSHILVHGVNKSQADLSAALLHAGVIVLDNLGELDRLIALVHQGTSSASSEKLFPDLWLRLRPGLAVDTHGYTQTGQDDSKFGLSPAEFLHAVQLCSQHQFPLKGLHFHQGSHFHDPSPLAPALETALDLVEEARSQAGWLPEVLSPGGGWGVAYHEQDLPHLSCMDYVQFVAQKLFDSCRRRDLPLPRLQFEPGRSLVARAGVALYRLGNVKHTPHRRWLLLDGGMADNPRVALYQARYSALPVLSPERPASSPAWLAGPYCESGDILIEALPLPELQPGEILAIPASGAYHLSMGSNYNGACKPAVLWLESGQAHLIQRRETLAELYQRDLALPESYNA